MDLADDDSGAQDPPIALTQSNQQKTQHNIWTYLSLQFVHSIFSLLFFYDPISLKLTLSSSMAPPKKHYLSLLLLLSLFILFIFTHFSLSPPTSLSNPPITHFLSPQKPSNPFTFTIKVLAFDRLSSISRCLNSLSSARYFGDTIDLHIFIDHFHNSSSSSDLGPKLENSHKILDFVDGFKWAFGKKLVHYRTLNVGLQAQWLESWWPSSDDEFVFVVEDDLEVSPLYYQFLKGLILNYYYNYSNFSPWIYGASLQRPRFVPGTSYFVLIINLLKIFMVFYYL